MIINCLRQYKKDATISRLIVSDEEFGHVLEDVGRPNNIKVMHDTCIPEGSYYVRITHSNRFKRPMMVLFNVVDDHSIERSGIRFTGIRVHSGETVKHTSGCPLVGANTNGVDRVTDSLEVELKAKVKQALDAGEEVMWVVSEDV